MKKRKIDGKGLATVFILLFLVFFFVLNLRVVKEPVKAFAKGKLSFKEFVEDVSAAYTSDEFTGKVPFINLNGLFARTVGQRECNDIVLLDNGMLSLTYPKKDMSKQAKAVSSFAKYTEDQGIPFLYIQAPYKEDYADLLYPTGVTSYANENADELLSLLSETKVEMLDLRPHLSETAELIDKYYFKTDHHWNFDGAFVGFREVVKKISLMFPGEVEDFTYTNLEQWESHTLENWSLGSRGKRVGIFFGGVDDVTWYTPKFETKMSRTVPKYQDLYKGDFTAANIKEKYIKSKDYFGHSTYCLYVGGDYPLVQHRNYTPVSDLKILLVKDSYSTPFQAFLSTMFAEIDVIDPRHFTECGLAEYVDRTQPDLVLLMMNPSVFWTEGYTDFGVKEAEENTFAKKEAIAEQVLFEETITVKTENGKQDFAGTIQVEPGTVYKMQFEDITVSKGSAEGVTVVLYDETKKTIINSKVFDLAYEQEHDGFTWIFDTPEQGEDISVRFYAGLPEEKEMLEVNYEGVSLWEVYRKQV